jgi:hypothetical protein
MRRALAIALTSLAVPATALAAEKPFHDEDLTPSPLLDKALMTHERVQRIRKPRERHEPQQVAIPAHLAAIAACESGGNPQAVSADGQYHGLFQFSQATWNATGGQGSPSSASVAEQVKRAEILYAQSGPGQWPVCGA